MAGQRVGLADRFDRRAPRLKAIGERKRMRLRTDLGRHQNVKGLGDGVDDVGFGLQRLAVYLSGNGGVETHA